MIVAHVGPPTGRLGGPPGYLHQLKSAAAGDPHPRHDVRFPDTSSGPRKRLTGGPSISLLTRLRRKHLTAKIASGEWDGIIVTHSSFERIGMSRRYQEQFLTAKPPMKWKIMPSMIMKFIV
jgi:hypothetical protein